MDCPHDLIAFWSGRQISAVEFVGSRVKLCYNMVVGDEFKKAHKLLQNALSEDKVDISLAPNGILPVVDPRIAAHAVNSDNVEDILVWRYKLEKLEELGLCRIPACLCVALRTAIREGAARVGLLPGQQHKKKSFLRR